MRAFFSSKEGTEYIKELFWMVALIIPAILFVYSLAAEHQEEQHPYQEEVVIEEGGADV